MRVLALFELMHLSEIELCALARKISTTLTHVPEGSPEAEAAHENLRNIRFVRACRGLSP